MASRLIYGMARQHVLPPVLGRVHPRRRNTVGCHRVHHHRRLRLIIYVSVFADSNAIAVLGGTTSLLLLGVFVVVNVAVLVLRRDVRSAGGYFRTPTVLPVIGCAASLYLVTPLSGRPPQQYAVAGGLVLLGVLLWGLTRVINRQLGIRDGRITDPVHLGAAPD